MSILREIRQRRPFPSAGQEATVALMRTADLVRRSVASVVEPFGITPQQYNVLRILRGAGDEGLPMLEIAERMIEQTPGITRLVDRLEAKELVRRVRCEKDRRQVLCVITGNGSRLLAALDEPVASAADASMANLNERQLAQLLSLLERARTGLHASLVARHAEVNQKEDA